MRMKIDEAQQMVEIYKTLSRVELAAAAYYNECASKFPKDREFWEKLVHEEENHALSIVEMYRKLMRKTHLFVRGTLPTLDQVEHFIQETEASRKDLREGRMNESAALATAQNIENTIIENKLDIIVKSSDSEFNRLVHDIIRETHEHHMLIDDRIKQFGAKPANPQRTEALNRDESSPQDEPAV
jgi:hypothetical protein